ncbi:MAG: GNAT family N-acetyltransferase [Dehalococcoidia bacterium]
MAWSDAWSRELDAALGQLPEMETCSHDLYRMLARTASSTQKKFALVRDEGTPIAAIALRRRHHHWQFMCDGVVPFAGAPAAPGRLWDAVSALGVYVRVFEWDGPTPDRRLMRFVERSPHYTVSTRLDFDAYWAMKGNRDWLRKARRRTEALGAIEFEVGGGDAARWTIDQWRRKWTGDPMGETDATPDILAAAAHLAARGRYHAFRLLIDGAPVAGVNMFAQGTTLVMAQSYRDPRYDRAGIGVHLDERIFRWSATSPYEVIDLGCGEGYKSRWGDEVGSRTTFGLAPAHVAAARRAAGMVRRLVAGRRAAVEDDITLGGGRLAPCPKQKLDKAVKD